MSASPKAPHVQPHLGAVQAAHDLQTGGVTQSPEDVGQLDLCTAWMVKAHRFYEC